jgi:hypothetical protein
MCFCRFLLQEIHNAEDKETRQIEAEVGIEQSYGSRTTIKRVLGIFGGPHFENFVRQKVAWP